MKRLIFSLTIAAAAALNGCSSLVSIHPFVSADQAVADPALAGNWTSLDGKEAFWIKQDADSYIIHYSNDSGDQYQFTARMMAADGVKILDLSVAHEDPFQMAVHIPVRVWVDANTLRMSFLQSDWLKEQAAQQIAATKRNDQLVLTAPGDQVAKFLAKFGGDARASGEPDVLRRVP